MGRKLDFALGVLNGAIGDHLSRTGNELATELAFVRDGVPLAMDRASLAGAYPDATPKLAILVHGLMCTESVWELPDSTDYGSRLAIDHGFTPLYVRYNSGRHISENGEAFARLLERLVEEYPVPIEEIVPIGFSMGGLVARSACHVASVEKLSWLSRVRRAFYVGTPHRGSPLERAGRVLTKVLRAIPDPYTQLIADIGDLRSAGLKDLGDADLRLEDRARWAATFSLRDPRHPVPLLPEIAHYLAAGSLSADPRLAIFFGDALVPVPSGTMDHCVDVATLALPPSHVKVFPGFAHMRMAHDVAVYEQISRWLGGGSTRGAS